MTPSQAIYMVRTKSTERTGCDEILVAEIDRLREDVRNLETALRSIGNWTLGAHDRDDAYGMRELALDELAKQSKAFRP